LPASTRRQEEEEGAPGSGKALMAAPPASAR
jgi:hypothetical protein